MIGTDAYLMFNRFEFADIHQTPNDYMIIDR